MKKTVLALMMTAMAVTLHAQTEITELEKKVVEGNTTAMIAMGDKFLKGDGVTASTRKAIEFYKKASAFGDVRGLTAIGAAYFNAARDIYNKEGELSAADEQKADSMYAEAVPYLQQAVDRHDAMAMYYLGMMYCKGLGTDFNIDEGAAMIISAARQGIACAYAEAARCYAEGIGVADDKEEAARLYVKSAEAGYVEGYEGATPLYFHDGDNVADNADDYFRWSRLGASKGSGHCLYTLGYCYFKGVGCTADQRKAVDTWKKIMPFVGRKTDGTEIALYALSECLRNGTGTKADADKADRLAMLTGCIFGTMGRGTDMEKTIAEITKIVEAL